MLRIKHGGNLDDTGFHNDFLNMTQHKKQKKKRDKLDLLKTNKFYSSKK